MRPLCGLPSSPAVAAAGDWLPGNDRLIFPKKTWSEQREQRLNWLEETRES